MKYAKRKGARLRGDPNIIGAELARLEKHHGTLTPDIVVESAKDPESPLHGEFEWDKSKAAHAHWLHQARMLIADITYEVEGEKTIRAFVNITRDDGREYKDTRSTMNDPELRAQVLARLQDEADDFADRASNYKEFARVCEEIKNASKRTRKRKGSSRKQSRKAERESAPPPVA